jgi:hypothetical protein
MAAQNLAFRKVDTGFLVNNYTAMCAVTGAAL